VVENAESEILSDDGKSRVSEIVRIAMELPKQAQDTVYYILKGLEFSVNCKQEPVNANRPPT